MTRILLTISDANAEAAQQNGGYDETFLWTRDGRSTFVGSVDPHLGGIGAVNPLNVDLVRIALAVFGADRSVRRKGGGSNWNARDFDITVEVNDPSTWTAHAQKLSQTVGFLSGDRWSFQFAQATAPEVAALPLDEQHFDRTVLLSGGADSAAGALLSAIELGEGKSHALVSQFSSTALSPVQQNIVSSIGELAPGVRQVHHQFRLHRGSKRLDGSTFRDEPSSRSRSLLFLALGLAVAERANSKLWIPENGFASLNPPLGADRRGSLSTHTTHPRFLCELSELMRSVGGHGEIENPFERLTKGEMFQRVADAIGADAASTYLSATNSCSHTDARYSGAPAGSSCGVCFGCLVRKSSFTASGVPDKSTYLVDDTSGQFNAFVKQKSIVEPMRDFARRGIRSRDVMTMSLPQDYPAKGALALCQRGIDELRSVLG
ncbi:hypothetical protein [Arthrobacter sp. D5-1]|uniref:hypothetical protein n=1 Tax=Arthrobacter sp. D5-1 TaxID=1477518 RepID=UPI001A99EA59|nr:hypothetical protein [Arthrobacter sp. D5-1]QSZ50093.1 hypothetical protein AYX22_17885 [Arthrobacter sp. D5-1]